MPSSALKLSPGSVQPGRFSHVAALDEEGEGLRLLASLMQLEMRATRTSVLKAKAR